ncbi:MAG: hypothetical protein ACRDMZ_04760, partial [Solirubrobacteraceae bacterium]
LDTRAPELLERAGWTVEEYLDFWNWNFYDDQQFTLSKLRRLIDTGGVPTPITLPSAVGTLRTVFDESPSAAWLFLAGVLGTVLLGRLRVIEPGRSLLFGLGYLACEIAVPVWMSSQYRFPQRVSLPFYVVAAFGMFVILAREIAARPAELELSLARARLARFALAVITVVLFLWARWTISWIDRPPAGYMPETRALIARTKARGGFVFAQAITTDFDPLVADPFGYTVLPGGWGTFTGLWYRYLAQFGLHHFQEVLPWMVDNPNAYVMATTGAYGAHNFENWSRDLLHNSTVRLAMVDVSEKSVLGRVALYRLVTQPLKRDTPEWLVLERAAWEQERWLAGPPDVTNLAFRPVAFAAPYARHASQLRASAAGITIHPIDGGLRCSVAAELGAACTTAEGDADRAGIRAEVHGLRAARFDLALTDAENIVSFHVLAESASHRTLQ